MDQMESRDREIAVAERLDRMTHGFTAGASTVDLVADTLDAAMLATGAPLGNVQLVNPASGALEIVAQRGFGKEFLDFFALVHFHGSACAAALRDRGPVLVSDVATDANYNDESRAVMLRAGARAVVSTPLLTTTGMVIGVASTLYPEPTRTSMEARALATRCARRAGALIQLRTIRPPGVKSMNAIIQLKLEAGLLPTATASGTIWSGFGSGKPCSGCNDHIVPGQAEYEFDITDQTYRFHIGCFSLWESGRVRRALHDRT